MPPCPAPPDSGPWPTLSCRSVHEGCVSGVEVVDAEVVGAEVSGAEELDAADVGAEVVGADVGVVLAVAVAAVDGPSAGPPDDDVQAVVKAATQAQAASARPIMDQDYHPGPAAARSGAGRPQIGSHRSGGQPARMISSAMSRIIRWLPRLSCCNAPRACASE